MLNYGCSTQKVGDILLPNFEYSTTLQVLLFFVSTITAILLFIYINNLILSIYGEKVSFKRRITFVLLIGLLNQLWIYGIYILGGYSDFSLLTYTLVTMPNPFFFIIYYYLGIKILKLSKYHSINLMKIVYHFVILTMTVSQFIGASFFSQIPNEKYNYMLDILTLTSTTIVYTITFITIKIILKRSHFFIRLQFKNSKPTKRPITALGIGFLMASAIYGFVVITPFLINPRNFAFFNIVIVLLIAFILNVLLNFNLNAKNVIENKDTYINKLTSIIDDFSGLKHDFNNILQTYGGYLSIGDIDKLKKYHKSLQNTISIAEKQRDIDFNQKMVQNHTLATLLISKINNANQRDVKIITNINCNIKDMYIDDENLSFALSDLLDYMTDLISNTKDKSVIFSIEENNSIKYIKIKIKINLDTKTISFDKIYSIMYDYLNKYNNVVYHIFCVKNEFITSIELSSIS